MLKHLKVEGRKEFLRYNASRVVNIGSEEDDEHEKEDEMAD